MNGSSGESSIAESAGMAGGPLFTPSLGSYGAIRMDPVAMACYLDSKAIEEAAAITPKTYLVYLMMDLGLPIPEMPWYCFEVHVIAPSLRPVEEEKCITPDMCIPIFPNDHHPTGQEPLRTKPIFPFSNCYHWDDAQVHIRVCAREEGFLVDDAIMLPSSEEWRLLRTLAELHGRAATARKARVPPPVFVPAAPEQGAVPGAPLSDPSVDDRPPPDAPVIHGVQASYDRLSCYSVQASQLEEDTAQEAVDAIVHLNVFGNPYADVEPLPLVHLWIDMPSEVKQDEIGSPVDFFKERDAIVKIIEDARARDPTLPTLAEVVGISSDPFGIDKKSNSDCASVLPSIDQVVAELHDEDDSEETKGALRPALNSRRFRLLKTFHKIKPIIFLLPRNSWHSVSVRSYSIGCRAAFLSGRCLVVRTKCTDVIHGRPGAYTLVVHECHEESEVKSSS